MRRSSRPSISPPIPQETWLDRETTRVTHEGTSFDLVNPRQKPQGNNAAGPAIPTYARSPSANPDFRSDRASRHPSVRYKRSQSTTPETRSRSQIPPPRATARPQLTTHIPSAFHSPVNVPARPASAPPESPVARPNPPPPYEAVGPSGETPIQIPLPGTMASRSPDLSRIQNRERSHSQARASAPESSRRGGRIPAPQPPPTAGQGQAAEKFGRKAKTFLKDMFRKGSVDDGEEVESVQVKHWADDDDY